ncbi:putative ubiquitin-like-specific protease 1B [Daucus carota subsp. sativus]|uniref:putative ubiquitin-like-specific protease 1B n=1 Tax=Daucus carota subsp. sativus TaxID=79200 RepID=UPI0030837BDE
MLLRDREEEIARLHDRKPTYFFMDPFFIPLAKTKNWKNPESYVKLHNFYCDYGSAEVGPTINKVDFIFLPTCVEENHWILFVFSVKTWGVVILDPLYDDGSYPEEEEIVTEMLPDLIRFCERRQEVFPEGPAQISALMRRPKQSNHTDCGIFVMKYMDYMLQGFHLQSMTWTSSDVETFRYRIAKEIQRGKARMIPGFLMKQRLDNASRA